MKRLKFLSVFLFFVAWLLFGSGAAVLYSWKLTLFSMGLSFTFLGLAIWFVYVSFSLFKTYLE